MPESETTRHVRAALGQQLALSRRAAGYSQHGLADQLSYSRSTLANVEVGRQNAPWGFWRRCDELLNSDGAIVRGYQELLTLVRQDGETQAREAVLHRQQVAVTGDGYGPASLTPAARAALHDIRRSRGSGQSSQLFAAMDYVRGDLERSLATSSVTAGQLDELEEAVVIHAHDCVRLPPIDMLCRLTLDTADVRALLVQPQPPKVGFRLRRISAGLSALIADELMVLGDVYAARSWYATARHAADTTHDKQLRSTIYALSAMLPLHWGRPAQAAKIAAQAKALAGSAPHLASAMAPSIEALALAKIGNSETATRVLDQAAIAFEELADSQREESVLAFSERRHLFYRGRTLTWLGRYQEAGSVYKQAKELYPAEVIGDPTLMRLDQAYGLVCGGDVRSGCELATLALNNLPAEHRGGIFLRCARRLLEVVPRHAQSSPTVKEYLELLRSLAPLPVGAGR